MYSFYFKLTTLTHRKNTMIIYKKIKLDLLSYNSLFIRNESFQYEALDCLIEFTNA